MSCVPTLKENPASRLNDYFRDELTSERDLESTYYLYQNSGLLFGHYTDGTWQFGLKVTGSAYVTNLESFNDHSRTYPTAME